MRHGLDELVERTGADELMVTTLTHGPADRLASYRLVAGPPAWPRSPPTTSV